MKPFVLIAGLLFACVVFVAFSDSAEQAENISVGIGGEDISIENLSTISAEDLEKMKQAGMSPCDMVKALRSRRMRQEGEENQKEGLTLSQWQWDALYYKINLNIDFGILYANINGSVQTQGRSLIDGLSFIELNLYSDLPDPYYMNVDSIRVNGSLPSSFSHADSILTIHFQQSYNKGDTFSVTTYYHGRPKPIVDSKWIYRPDQWPHWILETVKVGLVYELHNLTRIAYALSEPYYARSWWPCKDVPDDKADYGVDIIITHPDIFTCASNGVLDSVVSHSKGTNTSYWHHRYPISPYLVGFGITNYDLYQTTYQKLSGGNMPVPIYVYPEMSSVVNNEHWLSLLPEMLTIFSDLFGEYPFVNEKYGMLQTECAASLENQTITAISSKYYSQNIVVHEGGHQWWGDMITCSNWHHVWLNEGLASYCEALWVEQTEGSSSMLNYIAEKRDGASQLGGSIYVQDTTSILNIFDKLQYDKAPWVVHMLRHWVGDDTFFDIFRTYRSCFEWESVVTEDFRDVCIVVSGDTRLQDFFDDWIYGEYFPKYQYSADFKNFGDGHYVVYVHIQQIQQTNPTVFHMPIDITIVSADTSITYSVYNDRREQDFILDFPSDSDPSDISLPNDWILDSTFYENWTPHIIDRDLDRGIQGQSYLDSVIFVGGVEPYHFSIVSSSLPDSLHLDSNTGKISGTPTETGTFEFTVHVHDNVYPTHEDQKTFTLYIMPSGGVCGNVDGVWDRSGSPYTVTCDIAVPGGHQLTIEPGVEVLFKGHYKFNVLGTLKAKGTEEEPIIITHYYEDPESTWSGIRFNQSDTPCSLEYCHIEYGSATGSGDDANGGGIFCESSTLFVGNSVIRHCYANNFGGGIYSDFTNLHLYKCLIRGNEAEEQDGGGLYYAYNSQSSPVCSLVNCTFADNIANNWGGGAVFFDYYSPSDSRSSYPVVKNCILWDNWPDEIYKKGNLEVSYSDVKNGWTGEGNLNCDPLFDESFCLTWQNYPIQDTTKSCCIDAGDPYSPKDPDCTRADIGYCHFDQLCRTLVVSPYGNAPFNTIQGAIDSAKYCDTILLANGTYWGTGNRDIDFKGKTITIRSENGAEACTIDCWRSQFVEGPPVTSHRGFYFHTREGSRSVLEGVTIMNGKVYDLVQGYNKGGGIFFNHSSPTILNCKIIGNLAAEGGGGVCCDSALPTIIGCTITGNKTDSDGGGIYCINNSSPTIVSSTISGNKAYQGGGIYQLDTSSPYLTRSIVWGNCASSGNGDEWYCDGSVPVYCCSDVDGSGFGESCVFIPICPPESLSIYADPKFYHPVSCDSAPITDGYYCIWWDSPCVPDSQPFCGLIGALGIISGDVNADHVINVGDVVYLVSYLYRGGLEPIPLDAGDVNCDEIVNVGDVVYLVSYLYRGGTHPCCYYPE